MIYTLTFNPAIDYTVKVSDYTDGMVNRTDDEKIFAGGKGINVSAVLTNLGKENIALGFVAGFTGRMIEDIVTDRGIKCDFIRLDNGFSRINVKIKAESETDINGTGPYIDQNSLNSLFKKLDNISDGDTIVLAGSVPKSLSDSVYCSILEHIKEKKINIVIDATGELLTNTLKYEPLLIKPNIYELGEIFGKDIKSDTEVIECAKQLQQKGAKNVLVSMGADGAILVCEDGNVIKEQAPDGKVVNTTGAGDSMVAGFISGYLTTGNLEYALKLGLCAGSATSFSETIATKDEIMKLFNR